MKIEKMTGLFFVAGALGVFVPYTLLTIIFDYPDILRRDTGEILTTFHEGGSQLILTWWAFAILGLPLLLACILLGQKLEQHFYFVRWATVLGIIGLLVQMIGLFRWAFVVPVLSHNFITGNGMTKEASKVAFQVLHQYGGVVLGEHIGQLFTITWTLMMTSAFVKLKLFPGWVNWLAYTASSIYVLAQAELFATVIPGFPVWGPAGFIGSTLWLLWLIVIGIKIRRLQIQFPNKST